MSRLVKRQVLCLQMLNRTHNAKLRKAILEYADAELISALCECAHNILRGTVRLTPREKVRLRRYRTDLNSIVSKKTAVVRKRRILQQKGGFLPALLSPLASSVLLPTLLRIVPITGRHGEMVTTRFDHVQDIPVMSREFGTIETEIRDDTGRPVPFERGKVTVTLHFRRRSTGLFR